MKKLLLVMSLLMMFILSCGKNEVTKDDGKVGNFELKDLKGTKYKSSDILNNGKPTLFLVAAEWCPHCKEEAPDVQKFYDEYKDKVNVVVVYSNVNSSLDAVKEYISKNEYTFPTYYDEHGVITEGFKVQGFPFNLKIENEKIVEELELPVTYEKLVEKFGK